MVLTNVYGAALTLRATIPALKDSRGHLLLTSSVAGRRVLPGSMYSCTKHAVTAMGEAARQDLHGSGVRVTLIEPGMTDTPFFENRPQRCAAGRRHRPRRDVRGLAAAARRRQRDPRATDRPAGLSAPGSGPLSARERCRAAGAAPPGDATVPTSPLRAAQRAAIVASTSTASTSAHGACTRGPITGSSSVCSAIDPEHDVARAERAREVAHGGLPALLAEPARGDLLGRSSTPTPSAMRPPRAACAAPRARAAQLSPARRRQHADDAPAPAGRELHGAGGARVERVVLADADAFAGLEAGAALAHDDLAAGHGLPANVLTPRRWAFESRPLRLEPSPFL